MLALGIRHTLNKTALASSDSLPDLHFKTDTEIICLPLPEFLELSNHLSECTQNAPFRGRKSKKIWQPPHQTPAPLGGEHPSPNPTSCVRILSMTKLLLKWCKYWNWNWTEIISIKNFIEIKTEMILRTGISVGTGSCDGIGYFAIIVLQTPQVSAYLLSYTHSTSVRVSTVYTHSTVGV